MAKLVEYITPTWIPEEGDKCIPIYDSSIDGERIELVRCKDCKYWRQNTEFCGRWSVGNVARHTPPDWFCADGERKEGR